MKTLRALISAAILATSAGALYAAKPAPAPDVAAQTVALIEQFAGIVDKDKAACDTMGTDLNKFVDDNSALITKLQEEGKKQTEAQKQAAREKYKDRYMAALQKMKPGLTACHDNAKVKEALQRMRPHK